MDRHQNPRWQVKEARSGLTFRHPRWAARRFLRPGNPGPLMELVGRRWRVEPREDTAENSAFRRGRSHPGNLGSSQTSPATPNGLNSGRAVPPRLGGHGAIEPVPSFPAQRSLRNGGRLPSALVPAPPFCPALCKASRPGMDIDSGVTAGSGTGGLTGGCRRRVFSVP